MRELRGLGHLTTLHLACCSHVTHVGMLQTPHVPHCAHPSPKEAGGRRLLLRR